MPALLDTLDPKKHYRMGTSTVRALDGVSLPVPKSELIALLRTSGSGKSTLLNLIAGLDRPTEGLASNSWPGPCAGVERQAHPPSSPKLQSHDYNIADCGFESAKRDTRESNQKSLLGCGMRDPGSEFGVPNS